MGERGWRDGDGPPRPCAEGWHRKRVREGSFVYFSFGTRLRDGNGDGTLVYRLGPLPDDEQCRTVWCYGDRGRPWVCDVCRSPVDGSGA